MTKNLNQMNLKDLENILLEHCYQMSILRRDANQKKKDSILDSLIAAIIRSETTFEEVLSCIDDVKKDNVINLDFFKNGGNIDDYINKKWLKFAKSLWRQRSVGLGTPNAASGEGELMFIFLSPKIVKPTRGDLSINGENIEIKGEDVRVNGKITGKNFRDKTLIFCNEFGLTPNIAYRTNVSAVEIEKQQHETHWINELNKLNLEKRISFVSHYFKCIDENDFDASSLFNDGLLNFNELRKSIVKLLYKSMLNDRSFDKFIILGDGTNAKILGNDLHKFNKDIDNGIIEIKSDYFRINQDANIGWYIF
jgi:hypothetical protein